MNIELSIIIPTFNEMKLDILPKILSTFDSLSSFELVVVDRMSNDLTIEYIKSSAVFQNYPERLKILKTSSNKRGKRLQEGFEASSGRIVLLHHPRSFLSKEAFIKLLQVPDVDFWGGFTHRFDSDSLLLNFTSWYSNRIRGDFRGIYYLDHCIFATRGLLLQTGIPDVEIFEDTILSQSLGKLVSPIRITEFSITSSIRFKKNGMIYQSLLNQCMKLGFYLGIPLNRLNYFYEKSLELNSIYREILNRD